MKTTIFNEKTSRRETCKHFCKFIPFGVTGHCNFHRHIFVNVYGDSFCDCYKNKPVSRLGVVIPVTPFAPGWQTEQRKAFAEWYHKERTNGGI
jgi:hypothetical protein